MRLINDGGPVFMVPILFLLILSIIIFVKALISPKDDRLESLLKEVGLLALIWGLIGQCIGLISAFDAIESVGQVATEIVAGGLKITLLSALFGLLVFFIARLGAIILSLKKSD
jgi:hypothetical protein